jgi:hypothetical protein
MKGLKSDPDNQLVVAGIFGWPLSDANLATAQYKIAPVPNQNTADTQHPIVYDLWPICYDPYHMPMSSNTDPTTGFDVDAAQWGATGGLREAAFVDEFGANGLKYSACAPDYTAAMQGFGNALAKKLQSLCFDYKLVDTDSATDGVQADCRVVLRTPGPDPKDPTKIIYLESPTPLPQCPPGASNGSVATTCWQLASDPTKCPNSGQIVYVLRTAADISAKPQLDTGTKLVLQCRTCPALPSGAPLPAGCDY